MNLQTKSIWDPKEDSDGIRILISLWWPRGKKKDWFTRWDKRLAPSKHLLDLYKNHSISWDEYETIFLREMNSSNARKAMEEIFDLIDEGKTVTLLCFEKGNENTINCHRRLIKEIIIGKKRLDILDVPKQTMLTRFLI